MSDKLPVCPFCGKEPRTLFEGVMVFCDNSTCPIWGHVINKNEWRKRHGIAAVLDELAATKPAAPVVPDKGQFTCNVCGRDLPWGDYKIEGEGATLTRTCWTCAKKKEPWESVVIIDEATVRTAILQLQRRLEAVEKAHTAPEGKV